MSGERGKNVDECEKRQGKMRKTIQGLKKKKKCPPVVADIAEEIFTAVMYKTIMGDFRPEMTNVEAVIGFC